MPIEYKDFAENVEKGYRKKGVPEKEAKRRGYATATKQFMKKHGGETPQHYEKRTAGGY